MTPMRLTRRAGDVTVLQLGPMPEGGEIRITHVAPARGDIVFDIEPGPAVKRVFTEEKLPEAGK